MSRSEIDKILLVPLLMTMLVLSFNIQSVKTSKNIQIASNKSISTYSSGNINQTIYIRADGPLDPTTMLISTIDNITYTFSDDIICSVPLFPMIQVQQKRK